MVIKMSGDPGYPDDIRMYDSDPRSPFYNDPTESKEFEEAKDSIYREKVADFNGYFVESFGETSDEWLKALSQLCLKWGDSPADRVKDIEIEIGRMVARMVDEYCQPSDDEVIEYLKRFDDQC